MKTISDVRAAVHALGLTCSYDAAVAEFRINYRRDDPRWTLNSAYFADGRDLGGRLDAVATARTMAAAPVVAPFLVNHAAR